MILKCALCGRTGLDVESRIIADEPPLGYHREPRCVDTAACQRRATPLDAFMDALAADFAGRLADALTARHVKTAGRCSESHLAEARELVAFLRERQGGGA